MAYRLASLTDPEGNEIQRVYDAAGRMVQEFDPLLASRFDSHDVVLARAEVRTPRGRRVGRTSVGCDRADRRPRKSHHCQRFDDTEVPSKLIVAADLADQSDSIAGRDAVDAPRFDIDRVPMAKEKPPGRAVGEVGRATLDQRRDESRMPPPWNDEISRRNRTPTKTAPDCVTTPTSPATIRLPMKWAELSF